MAYDDQNVFAKILRGEIPAAKVLEGVSKLARGNLKGLLGSLLQAGLAGAITGGAMLGPMVDDMRHGMPQDSREGLSGCVNVTECVLKLFVGYCVNEIHQLRFFFKQRVCRDSTVGNSSGLKRVVGDIPSQRLRQIHSANMAWTSVPRKPPCGKEAGATNCSVVTFTRAFQIFAFVH